MTEKSDQEVIFAITRAVAQELRREGHKQGMLQGQRRARRTRWAMAFLVGVIVGHGLSLWASPMADNVLKLLP